MVLAPANSPLAALAIIHGLTVLQPHGITVTNTTHIYLLLYMEEC